MCGFKQVLKKILKNISELYIDFMIIYYKQRKRKLNVVP